MQADPNLQFKIGIFQIKYKVIDIDREKACVFEEVMPK
jgi:hypothetical protein